MAEARPTSFQKTTEFSLVHLSILRDCLIADVALVAPASDWLPFNHGERRLVCLFLALFLNLAFQVLIIVDFFFFECYDLVVVLIIIIIRATFYFELIFFFMNIFRFYVLKK